MICSGCGQRWAPLKVNGRTLSEEERAKLFQSDKLEPCGDECIEAIDTYHAGQLAQATWHGHCFVV